MKENALISRPLQQTACPFVAAVHRRLSAPQGTQVFDNTSCAFVPAEEANYRLINRRTDGIGMCLTGR